MIKARCRCGKLLKVKDEDAGTLGRCPTCGRLVPIPTPPDLKKPRPTPGAVPIPPAAAPAKAPPAKVPTPVQTPPPPEAPALAEMAKVLPSSPTGQTPAPARTSPGGSGRGLVILVGLLMLATVVVPWQMRRGKVVLSYQMWDALVRQMGDDGATRFMVFLVGAWAIGLAAVIVSATVKPPARAFTYAGLGLLGFVLLLIVGVGFRKPRDWSALGGLRLGVSPTLLLMLVALMSAMNHLRLRLGARPVLRACQVAAGALALVLALTGLVGGVGHFLDFPRAAKAKYVFDLIFMILMAFTLIAACLLSVVDGLLRKISRPALAATGLVLVYLYFGGSVLYRIGRPALATLDVGGMLFSLNLMLLIASIFLLFLEGALGALPRLFGQPFQLAEAGGPGAGLEDRLKGLKRLRDQGLITEAEYDAARAKTLEDL